MAIDFGKKLLPALNKVVGILSDPKLTLDEKVSKLGDDLIDTIEDWGPDVASAGGKLGLKVLQGIGDSFLHSDLLGKLFIGAGALRLFGGPGVFGKLGATIGRRVLGGMAGSTVAGGGLGGLLTTPGYSPTRPLFVTVVGGGLPGGEPVPPGTRSTIGKIGDVAKRLGPLAVRGAGTTAAEAAGTSAALVGGAYGIALPIAAGGALANKLGIELAPKGSGAPTRAQANIASLRVEIKKLAEAGEAIPANLIVKAGLDPKAIEAAGYEIKGMTRLLEGFREAGQNVASGVGKAGLAITQLGSGLKVTHSAFKGAGESVDAFSNGVTAGLQHANKSVDEHRSRVHGDMQGISSDTSGAGKAIGNYSSGADKNFDKVSGKSKQMAATAGGNVWGLSATMSTALEAIGTNVNEALKGFGVKKIAFSFAKVADAASGFAKHQTGGVIVPGQGNGDKVPAMLEPGEVIWNKKAVAAMGGAQRANEINSRIPRFATGGVATTSNVSLPPSSSPVMGLAQTLSPPYVVTSGTDGTHAANGYHPRGLALDYGNSVNDLGSLATKLWPMARQFAELFMPTSVPHGGLYHDGTAFSDSALQAEHQDHIHVALTHALSGKMGSAAQQVARMVLKGPNGPLKSMGQGALDKVRAAANTFIASKAPTATSAGMDINVGKGSIPDTIAAVARKLHAPKSATLAAYEAAIVESGDPTLHTNPDYGDASSRGIFQLLASTASGMGINPMDVAAVTQAFFQRGFWGKGGAISLADQGYGAGDIAQLVEGSAYPDRYAAVKGTAQGFMSAEGFKRGGVIPSFAQEGPAFHGLTPKAIKTLGSSKALKRRKELKGVLEGIGGLGLRPTLTSKIQGLADQADAASKWADIASQMRIDNPTDSQGNPLMENGKVVNFIEQAVHGKTESGWLTEELQARFEMRNALVVAQEAIIKKVAQVHKMRERAKAQLDKIAKALRNAQSDQERLLKERTKVHDAIAKAKDTLSDELDKAKAKGDALTDAKKQLSQAQNALAKEMGKKKPDPKVIREQQNIIAGQTNRIAKIQGGDTGKAIQAAQDEITHGQARLGSIQSKLNVAGAIVATDSPQVSALKDKIIPAFVAQETKIREALSNFSSLDDLQGSDGPKGVLKDLPALGVLGGDIFVVQKALADLGLKPRLSDPDSTSGGTSEATSELLALTQAQLLASQQNLAVSQLQMPVFRNFAGMFAKGGDIAAGKWGIAGETGMPEIVTGPARVYSPSQSAGMLGGGVNVGVYLYADEDRAMVDVNGQEFEVAVQRVNRKADRLARRNAPGIGASA